ncbi:MAG: nucleoside-diphosphate sugar epimerase/dehydratase [Campylobacterota bacterium]|nr:nucleoside-diphosphate sugar epimerase/dehydratase [Campylobacterota bacterium]
MFNPTSKKRTIFFISFDIIISLFTLFLAYNLRFNFDVEQELIDNFYLVFIYLVILKVCAIRYFKIYKITWRFFALSDAKKLLYAHLVAYFFFTLLYYIFPESFEPFPRSVLIIDLFLSLIFIGFIRISKRLILESEHNINMKKTLIIGVSHYTQSFIKQKKEFYISAIVDIDSKEDSLIGSYISNIEVKSLDNIESIIKDENISCVIITKELTQDILTNIYDRLNKINITDIKIATLNNKESSLKSLSVEDLLARHPADLDKSKIKSFIKDKKVLITGAGGSIGSEISRQVVGFGAKEIILLDHSEFNLYTIAEELKDENIKLIMQSVLNKELLDETFQKYKPNIVIHAAAYKHVPLVEQNIQEAILNNIIGTKNTIDISIKNSVEKFILISTDKAVRPTNVMGTTKRICELYLQNVKSLNTEVVAVRFGNVLGSSGSVIPKFKSQIEQRKNITVTDKDITRYFMLIPEACELVLQAGAIGKGGEIFILDMGEPVKIVDLAKKMIELSGVEGIDIEFTGLRAGEKLYEELLLDDSDTSTDYKSITVANPTKYDISKLNKDIEQLVEGKDKLSKLKEIVPEFEHKVN